MINAPKSTNPVNTMSGQRKPTIIPKAREMNLKEFYEKRMIKIRELFKSKHLSLDQYLTKDDILNFLDNLGGKPFNREVAEQLMEKLTSYPNPNKPTQLMYSLQEFVDTHVKAEYLLLVQVEDLAAELEQIAGEIKHFQKQYEKSKNSDEKSSLQITIMDAFYDDEEGYEVAPGTGYSVIVLCDNYKYETEEYIMKDDFFEPVWDHTFHIRVSGPDQKIRILLRDSRRFATEDNYKDLKCTISLESYQDLKEHETVLDLYDGNGQPTRFKIRANIVCSFAESNYLEGNLKELLELEEQVTQNKAEIEGSLRDLVYPFAFPVKGPLKM